MKFISIESRDNSASSVETYQPAWIHLIRRRLVYNQYKQVLSYVLVVRSPFVKQDVTYNDDDTMEPKTAACRLCRVFVFRPPAKDYKWPRISMTTYWSDTDIEKQQCNEALSN